MESLLDKFLTSTVFSGDSQSIVQGSPFYLSGSSSSTKEVFVGEHILYMRNLLLLRLLFMLIFSPILVFLVTTTI